MSAEVAQTDGEQLSDVEQKAIEIIETAGEHDTILFNDRVQPLTVDTAVGPYDGRSGLDYLELNGPRGGNYQLLHRDGSRFRNEEVKLQRHTGEYDDEHGFPIYEELPLEHIELVDHHEWRIGQVYEVADPIRGDEFYHVVTGLPDSGCYGIETADIRVEDGEVVEYEEGGLFNRLAKESVFNGNLELVDDLPVGYSGDRGVHYDTERQEEIRLSDPHRRGVDLRPTEGTGLEVVDWDTILFGFDDRFQDGEPEQQKELVADGGVTTAEQTTIGSHSGREIVEYERGSDGLGRGVYCPDCGQEVTATKGSHPAPDDCDADKIWGWECRDCKNTLPSNTHSAEARGFNDRIVGIKANPRGGEERWIPVPVSSLEKGE